MSYREVIVGGAILCAIVGFFVVLSMAAEPWLGSDQSSVTRVIQLALTPAFLLTAVAALLNVFSTRLGRVADRVDLLSADLQRGAAMRMSVSRPSGPASPLRRERPSHRPRRGQVLLACEQNCPLDFRQAVFDRAGTSKSPRRMEG
jgi:hypothetical protein